MILNYKSLIKNRSTREALLSLLRWIPDKMMISIQYQIKTGRKLNLANPERFSEKLQWLKLYYRDPLMAKCVDKVDVRDYVRDCGLEKILVKMLGVYSHPSEIDYRSLPNSFVMKDALGGGGNDVIVCQEKQDLDVFAANKMMEGWVKPNRHRCHPGREWVYNRAKPSRILVEELLQPVDSALGLVEYKFFCFNGEPKYLYVLCNRILGHEVKLGIFEVAGFKRINVFRTDEKKLEQNISKSQNYEQMIEAARRLSKRFPEVRVDFYDMGEKGFRFGELTFFDGSGYFTFNPDDFDYVMGAAFELPDKSENV